MDPISNIATTFFDGSPGIREYSIPPQAKANKATLTLGVLKMSAGERGLRQLQRAPASENLPLEDSGAYTHASTVDWSHHPVAQPADSGPNRNNVDLVNHHRDGESQGPRQTSY